MENNKGSSEKPAHDRSNKGKTIDDQTLIGGERRDLPRDVIQQILVRLPVKSLLKFKCVEKSWLNLISSQKFIKAHLEHSTLDPTLSNCRLMLCNSNRPIRMKQYSVNSIFSNSLTDAVEYEFPETQTFGVPSIFGSCNGLLCVHLYNDKSTFLWNPSLRMSKKLPPVSKAQKRMSWASTYGMGYDELNGDYMVLRLFRNFSNVMAEIYSLKNDSWKTIKGFRGCNLPQTSAIYAEGMFHFQALFTDDDGDTNDWSIVSLDLEREVYKTVEHPESNNQDVDISIGALKGCITALYNYAEFYADLWVLKEYEVTESWTRLIRIPYFDGGLYSSPLCALSDGKVLLAQGRDSKLVVYNPENSTFFYPRKGERSASLGKAVYVESLVPLLPS